MIGILPVLVAAAQAHVADASALRLSRAQVERIAAECRVPRSWMRRGRDSGVRLRFPPDAAYERVDCVLRRTRAESRQRVFTGSEKDRF